MDQFIFKSKYKNTLIAFMVIGLISMVITWFQDDACIPDSGLTICIIQCILPELPLLL